MKILMPLLLLLLMTCPKLAFGQDMLQASPLSAETRSPQDLGSLQVEGVGTVKFTAMREGTRIIVQAVKADGKVAGRAESVIGISETPIYVQTPKGLKKLTILWKGP